MLRRLRHAKALRNDHHVGSCFADLEGLFQQRGVKRSLKIEPEERLRQRLAHLVEELIEDLAEFRIQSFTELLLRVSQPVLEILQHRRSSPEQSDRDEEYAGRQKNSSR